MVEMPSVAMKVNGESVEKTVEARRLLVEYLRYDLGLTGTHVGCDTTQCGACTILLNGEAVKSCTMLAVQAAGAEVTTIEGVGSIDALHSVQEGFHQCHGLQCGFCTPGMIMSAVALLDANPDPSEQEIRHWLDGNICRCTGYQNIVAAIRHAAGRHCETPSA